METFSALLALCAGNSLVPVNSPHKGQWRGALMFSLICAWINGWVSNREAGDLRHHHAYYDATVMLIPRICIHGVITVLADGLKFSMVKSGRINVYTLCLFYPFGEATAQWCWWFRKFKIQSCRISKKHATWGSAKHPHFTVLRVGGWVGREVFFSEIRA